MRVCTRRAPLHARRAERCGRRRDCAVTVAVGGGARDCRAPVDTRATPGLVAQPHRESRVGVAERRCLLRANRHHTACGAPSRRRTVERPTLTAEGFRPTQRIAVRCTDERSAHIRRHGPRGKPQPSTEALGRMASDTRSAQRSQRDGRALSITVSWNTVAIISRGTHSLCVGYR